MVSILICSTSSNNYKKPAYDNGFYAKSHFVDNVCCSITNNETSRNCSISAPVRLTSRAKLLSQMNPIAGSMSVDSRSVEIQARAQGLPVRLHGEFRRITGRGADANKTTRMTLCMVRRFLATRWVLAHVGPAIAFKPLCVIACRATAGAPRGAVATARWQSNAGRIGAFLEPPIGRQRPPSG